MQTLRIVITDSADEFSESAGDLLGAALEHNVLATVTLSAQGDPAGHPGALFAFAHDGESVVAAALRTPPRSMLASVMGAEVAGQLMEAWLDVDPGLPGVRGPEPAASHLVAAWKRLTGGGATDGVSEALYQLERVVRPSRPAKGSLRRARAGERELLVRWSEEFAAEAGLFGGDTERSVDRSLARGGLHVWEDREPVSMVGVNPAICGVVRVGPVYTPPRFRDHGYASSAVAAVSELSLSRGASRCMLFTDLSNSTSNGIYAALGYERHADFREYELNAPAD